MRLCGGPCYETWCGMHEDIFAQLWKQCRPYLGFKDQAHQIFNSSSPPRTFGEQCMLQGTVSDCGRF